MEKLDQVSSNSDSSFASDDISDIKSEEENVED